VPNDCAPPLDNGRGSPENGSARNRRPLLEIVAPGATPEEAAAVVAALERFMRETAPPPAAPPAARNPWQRTALIEGVERDADGPTPWGDGMPWG
jgi:hypothetical protein